MYGYDGISTQRVTAIVDGARKVLAWGDDITDDDVAAFVDEYADVRVEDVTDPAAEAAAYPLYAGMA